jgi:enoyl-CoA hydratase
LSGTGLVSIDLEDGVASLMLNDPDHRNALSWEMVRAIVQAVDESLRSGCGAIILTNAPPVFCAGGSVDDLLEPKVPLERMYEAVAAVEQATVPTLAAIDGAAIGAGLNLALACDIAICTPDSRFDARFLDLGLHPGGGQLWRLRSSIGRQGAAALSLFGEVVTGREAANRALVWRCVEPSDLMPEALRLAHRAASHDGELMATVRTTLDASAHVGNATAAVDLELPFQRWSMERPAFEKALTELRRRLGR